MSREAARLLLGTLRLDGAPLPRAEAWRGPLPGTLAAVIRDQGGASWLLRRLVDRSLINSVPAPLAAALRSAAAFDAAACQLVDAECAAVLDVLRRLEAPHVLLKGAARRALAAGLPLADARLTRDVDVLVREADAQRVWRHLVDAGYRDISTRPQGGQHYHLPALLSPSRVAVELHTSIARGLDAGTAWSRFDGGARTVQWLGRDARVPGPTELLAHAMAHAATDMVAGYRLKALLDGAVMLQPGVAGPDRAEIARRVDAGELGEPARMRAWLGAAASLAGEQAPAAFPLERVLAWRLRTAGASEWSKVLGDAAVRAEAGLPAWTTPAGGGAASPRRVTAAVAARFAYHGWRLLAG